MKYPIKRYEQSHDTGSILVVDANNDCVCMCDDVEMADSIIKRLNDSMRADAGAFLRKKSDEFYRESEEGK